MSRILSKYKEILISKRKNPVKKQRKITKIQNVSYKSKLSSWRKDAWHRFISFHNKVLRIGKGELIKKLQNQSHNLTLDLESLKLCQNNLPYDSKAPLFSSVYLSHSLASLPENAKPKLAVLLEGMIVKIQEELEDIVGMINTVFIIFLNFSMLKLTLASSL